MKKSQIALAATLAMVSSSVAPLTNLYTHAEAVQDGCDFSFGEGTSNVVSADEIAKIIERIQNLDLYRLYQSAQSIKAKYQTPVEYNGTKMSLAESLDQALTDATSAKADAETAVQIANSSIGTASTLTNLAGMVKDLMNEGKAPESYTTPADFAILLDDAKANVPFYDEYQVLIRAVVANNVADVQAAARALNEARVKAGKDPEFSMTDGVLKTGATMSDITTSLGNRTSHPAYIKHKTIFDIASGKATQVEALRTAKTTLADSEAALTTATAQRNEALTEIDSVFENFRDNAIAVKNFGSQHRNTVASYIKLVTGAYNGDSTNVIISGYDEWAAFTNYLTGITPDLNDDNSALESEIKTKLGELVDSATVENIFNPVAFRKVCSADGNVAISGMLPLYKLVVKAELIDNLDDMIFAHLEQAVYDIKIEYKGTAYTDWSGDYQVIVNLPAEMDGATTTVYSVNGNIREKQESFYDATHNTISFTAQHFGRYALVGENNFGGFAGDDQFTVDGEQSTTIIGGESSSSPIKAVSGIKSPDTGSLTPIQHGSAKSGSLALISGVVTACVALAAAIIRRFRRTA